jgi:hypothetical protein
MAGKSVRPVLVEWEPFAAALKDLAEVEISGYSKTNFARFLGMDRGDVGAILEAREPCPESLLIRLYKRTRNNGRSAWDPGDLRLLVHLWAQAADTEPGDVLQQQMAAAGTPWTTVVADATARATGPRPHAYLPEGSGARKTRRSILALVAVFALVGGGAVALVWSRDASTPDFRHYPTTSHRFPADYSGDIQVQIRPTPEHTGRDHWVLLEWGGLHAVVHLPDLPAAGETLVTWKDVDDETVPLRVTVAPSAQVAFRRGPASDGVDINDDWKGA